MIRFTSGSVFKVISLCKSGRRYSDESIAEMLFPKIYTKGYIGHVKDCTKNLPDEIFQFMKNNNQADIINTLYDNAKKIFNQIIKTELQHSLIAAIQQIIKNDLKIADNAQIGYDPKYTKNNMVSLDSLDPIEFIANVLFYVCSQQNNPEGKDGIKELNKNYIDNLKGSADRITFLYQPHSSFSEANNLSPTFAGDDYHILCESPNGEHTVVLYEKFTHSWKIKNSGLVEWVKRLLVLANKDSTRIKSIDPQIHIPDLKPGENATITANLDARYFEGTHELIWDIQTEDGTSCYPNKAEAIRFDVTVKNNL